MFYFATAGWILAACVIFVVLVLTRRLWSSLIGKAQRAVRGCLSAKTDTAAAQVCCSAFKLDFETIVGLPVHAAYQLVFCCLITFLSLCCANFQ